MAPDRRTSAVRPPPGPGLAGAIAGRNKLDLTAEVRSRYGVDRSEELSISDASDLIDALKAPANGRGGECGGRHHSVHFVQLFGLFYPFRRLD
jgi:hypothetical protein